MRPTGNGDGMTYDTYEDDFEKTEPDHTREEIEDAREQVEDILRQAVHISTGRTDFAPRAGQLRLARNIITSAMKGGHAGEANLAEAPTGLGKSFAGLAPAAYMASLPGDEHKRTVVATESINLQSQYVDKDAATITEATKRVTGYEPKIVLLKGWGNYVCLASAVSAAEQVLGLMPSDVDTDPVTLIEALRAHKSPYLPPVGGNTFTREEIVPLLIWALEQGMNKGSGDKAKYPGQITDDAWKQVSVSPAECVGTKCPLYDLCLPARAKMEAQEADIIVTNHSMIAVQAATGAKVVLGNSKVGDIDIVIIDEAHALPNIVRNQGRGEVSTSRLYGIVRAMNKAVHESVSGPWTSKIEAISTSVNSVLNRHASKLKPGEVMRLKPEDRPLEELVGIIDPWLMEGRRIADSLKNNPRTEIQLSYRRLSSVLDSFGEAFDAVNQHRAGVARWIEAPSPMDIQRGRTAPSAKSAPVDVSGMLRFNIWENRTVDPDTEEPIVEPRCVVNMSATLPGGFGFQVGLGVKKETYESPFEVAYKHSGLYVPMFTKNPEYSENWAYYDEVKRTIIYPDTFDASVLGTVGWGNKWKFDTRKHIPWATAQMMRLVERNGGRALVLAATVGAGKKYVEALRHHAKGEDGRARWAVHSQWEGEALGPLVTRWKEDETAVLVGTKSLMTGVDAPGQTASLIVVDRPPRAAGNPVDDARVELLMEKMDYGKWDADRLVYVSDAALLLEQAAGRGIRQVDDMVLIAVLEPRMLKQGNYTYPSPTQKTYMSGLKKFGDKMTHIEDAFDYIDEMREKFPPAPKPPKPESKGIDFAALLAGKA